jgi:hypothetical protein
VPVFSRDGVNILYVHVPKTGGSPIEQLFANNGFALTELNRDIQPTSLNAFRLCSPQHMHREQLLAIFSVPSFSYVFMTVRNPYDRMKSLFRMRRGQGLKRVFNNFNDWVADTLAAHASRPYLFDNHVRRQVDFRLPRADIFRQEDGYDREWAKMISQKIGVRLEKLSNRREMVSPTDPTHDISMSDTTRALIREAYAADFELFKYKP